MKALARFTDEELAQEQKRRSVLRDVKIKRSFLTCHGGGCGKRIQIGKLTYINNLYWNTSYDRHESVEGAFICPHCGHRNRMRFRSERELKLLRLDEHGVPWIQYHFARSVDEYQR